MFPNQDKVEMIINTLFFIASFVAAILLIFVLYISVFCWSNPKDMRCIRRVLVTSGEKYVPDSND